ncbi:MAG: T9SS type A sorting domain-containing protein [Mariniphaga sp.]
MKSIAITTFFIVISIGLTAQTVITYSNNGLIPGDSYNFKEIQFPDPGSAGPNQIWDFSKVQFTGKTPAGNLQSPAIPKMDGIGDYNLSLLENGYDYFLDCTETDLQELGYVNSDLKITLKYSDPVVKMKYPFSFGASFTDHFIGIGTYSETNTIDFFGDHTVTADAYGTLILPDRTIENTLRVKSVKTGMQINMCGTADVNITKYNWYANGYRYPVLSLTTVENHPNIGMPQITQTAFTNTQQPNKSITIPGVKAGIKAADPSKSNVTVVISPNPFNDKLTYQYDLGVSTTVSIELYSITGKNISWIVKNQIQPVGLQTGELKASTYDLTPGVYFIRFTFDRQIVICKVVKL